MKKQITVKLESIENTESVIISSLPIGKYAELVRALKNLPASLSGFDKMTNEQLFAQLPNIIAENLPDVLAMLTIATPLKMEELEQLDLNDVVEIVMAIVEVNRYDKIYDKVKKAFAPKTEQAVSQ
ncbi:MAG: hypothetical protein WBO32_05080 [Cyclobacteriaceae bacterium]